MWKKTPWPDLNLRWPALHLPGRAAGGAVTAAEVRPAGEAMSVEEQPLGSARARAWLTLAVLAVAGLTFAADLQLTLGASAAPLYEIAVLLALWSPRRWFAVEVAGLVSLLIFAEGVLRAQSPEGSTAFNRAMMLLAVWSTAVLMVLYKRAEHALRERQREAQNYLDIAAVAIVATGRDGRVTLINRRGCEILGLSAAEVLGRLWIEDFLAPEYREQGAATLQRLLGGRAEPGLYDELPIVTASGERRTIAWRSAVTRDEVGRVTGVLSSGEDITERRRAEEAARAQQALARVGQMAAVVAHEVRNPLAGIRGATQVLSERLGGGAAEREVVRAVLDRIDALTEITDELLLFARPRPLRSSQVALRRVLDEAVLLIATSREHAGVAIEIEGRDVLLVADARLLKNVFFNLFLNAAQAMDGRGTVRITIGMVGRRVSVSVADQGPGIRPEWRDHIFEPFFTTRHRGTGLGLAIVKRDVEQHGGAIDVACPAGGGTVVTVTLPVDGARD
ncbi:MAG TPA: ATP-binding protein [Thermoanaerobaculia bacterium]|nr:ATP-binding protein [Thermoanaerobaculia bacterium]